PISYYAIRLRQKRNLDESLDVWACHGMGGVWGAIATGIFATEAGTTGLIAGNLMQFLVQLLTVGIVIAFAFVVTYVISKLLDRTVGLRVTTNEEEVGLDISEHGEKAYA
ncbi:MAG: ammonium transporter, partial [Anaerolineaceae bacterium]|nr:ammonium transporter [Anaerolineaceae bacterium]